MSIAQAGIGAVVAATLVFTPAAPADPNQALKLTFGAVTGDVRQCADAVLTLALDTAGELSAHLKRF